MKKLFYILNWIFISTIIFSCEKDIIIDTPNVESQLSVEGWINNGETPIVLLSSTFPAYGKFDLLEIIDSLYLSGAEVSVESNGLTYPLQEVKLSELPQNQQSQVVELFQFPAIAALIFGDLPVYTDTTGMLVGQTGNQYNLSIEYESTILSATTTIPIPPAQIDSVTYRIEEDNDTLATVFLNLTVPNITDGFIRYATKRNDEPFLFPDVTGSVFDSGVFAGERLKLPVERGYARLDSVDRDISEFGLFVIGDSVTVRWQNIDRATYDFWFTIENDGGATPFSNPTTIKTNINGGLGIWAGYNNSFYSIYIQD